MAKPLSKKKTKTKKKVTWSINVRPRRRRRRPAKFVLFGGWGSPFRTMKAFFDMMIIFMFLLIFLILLFMSLFQSVTKEVEVTERFTAKKNKSIMERLKDTLKKLRFF